MLGILFGFLLFIGCNTIVEPPPASPLLEGGVEATGAFLLAWQAGNMVVLIRHTERRR